MQNFLRVPIAAAFRSAMVLAVVAGLATVVADRAGHADTLPVVIDLNSAGPFSAYSYPGAGTGALFFDLFLPTSGAPWSGSFGVDVSSTTDFFRTVTLLGFDGYMAGDSRDYDADYPPNAPLVNVELPDPGVYYTHMTWSVLLTAGDVSVAVTNGLLCGPDCGVSDPTLSVRFEAAPSSGTPIPGSLPLFASGIGALGLAAWRRRRSLKG
jgi:hypothetical protein